MAKKFDIKNTSLYRRVRELATNDAWPFETVTAKDFLKASSDLLEMLHNMESRKIDNKRSSPEAYMDRTLEATIQMLQCIQKMELEASAKEMDEMLNWNEDDGYGMEFLDAHEFVEYAIERMYAYNNKICDHLAPDLEKHGIIPRYIDAENERTYLVNEECTFTNRATSEHYDAMKEAYDEIENLIQYGLPSSSVIGKIRDRITGSADIKDNNQTIVDKILSSEADLEIVQLYILPELELKIQEYEARALLEEANTKNKEDLGPGELQQSDPHFFRNKYMSYLKAREEIEGALLTMQKKELQLESNCKISIDKDPKAATYLLTAQWSRGEKYVAKDSQQLTDNITKQSTVVKEKDREEKSIKIQIGRSSNRLYEETRKQSACKFGYINRQELKYKDKSLTNIFSSSAMRREAMIRRRTKVAGQSEYEAQISVDLVKAEDKIVCESHKENGEKQEKTLVKVTANLGSAKSGVDAKNGVPVINGAASIAGLEANVLDVAKASASLGSVNYSSNPGIVEKVKETVVGHVLGDTEKSLNDAVKEIAESVATNAQNISVSGPKASANIKISDMSVLSASYDENGVQIENKIAKIFDTHSLVTTEVAQISANGDEIVLESANMHDNQSGAMIDEMIDMQILDVDHDKFELSFGDHDLHERA